MSRTVPPLSVQPRTDAVPLRRSGWLLVASLPVFAAGVIAVSLNTDRFRAEQDAADRLGLSVHDLPGDVLAPIAQEHTSLWLELGVISPTIIAFALFGVGIWLVTRQAGGRGALARGAAVVAGVAWVGCMALFLSLLAEGDAMPWVRENFPALAKSTTAVSVIAGCLAVIALAAHLRRLDIARRTGLVVTAVAVLVAVLAPIPAAGGMPPAAACLLAMVIGIAMIRTRQEARIIG
ncbi:hypothetical protein [Nocardioides limicola]|uniref:hypothetical protein n=1 Tax=Nocardioides limicola TaxID=2803368 RepID=UPI00193B6267|nr:hypothetical protein [Nocardioides sp. DJM-14]